MGSCSQDLFHGPSPEQNRVMRVGFSWKCVILCLGAVANFMRRVANAFGSSFPAEDSSLFGPIVSLPRGATRELPRRTGEPASVQDGGERTLRNAPVRHSGSNPDHVGRLRSWLELLGLDWDWWTGPLRFHSRWQGVSATVFISLQRYSCWAGPLLIETLMQPCETRGLAKEGRGTCSASGPFFLGSVAVADEINRGKGRPLTDKCQ